MNRLTRTCCFGLLTCSAAFLHASDSYAELISVGDGALQQSDPQGGDWFGYAVAVQDDVAVVGAWAHSLTESNGGAAYVYRRGATGWGTPDKLTPDVSQDDHRFGIAVAITNDQVLVGAHHDATEEWASGAVFVYGDDGTSWQQVQKLTPGDGVSDGRFGITMAVSGTTALFGTRAGAAYAYVHDGTAWQQQQKLTASDGAGEAEKFGAQVAVDGDVAVLGAPAATLSAGEEGAAYVFTRTGTAWSETQKLVATGGLAYDNFGEAVAIQGDTILVGSPYDDDGGSDAGAVYVFRFDGSTWSQESKLVPAEVEAGDTFGSSLSMRGNVAIGGSPSDDDSAPFAGSAILFQQVGGAWLERGKILGPSGAMDDAFGTAVATDGSTVLVGAPADDDAAADAGMAFSFLVRLENGDPCSQGPECASEFCVDGVCCESACDGGATASCSACSVAAGSTEDGVCGFASSGTECADASCSGPGELQPASTCDGQGACVDGTATSCESGYVCRDSACLDTCVSADDCLDGFRCGEGACVALLDDGATCTEAEACDSGFCVSGVCCNEACGSGTCTNGTCETSDGGTSDGGTDGGGGSSGAPSSSGSSGDDDGGCGCRAAGAKAPGSGAAALILVLAAALGLRRKR